MKSLVVTSTNVSKYIKKMTITISIPPFFGEVLGIWQIHYFMSLADLVKV
jgi:hypothetical protein